MTLSFSQNWPERMGELAGQPNCFVEKIWTSLPDDMNRNIYLGYGSKHRDVFRECWDGYYATNTVFKPKLHTIREDKNDRWKSGNDIHFVINNRTKNRFQFAPVVKCVSVQEIRIKWMEDWSDSPIGRQVLVFIDGELINVNQIEQLAINDGFPSVEAFFQFFDKDFSGKIIHWTDLKY